MEIFVDEISNLPSSNSFQLKSSSQRSKLICFPFSVSRMTNRVALHLYRRTKRRFLKKNKQHSPLTPNMDSYRYTPSDNEIQKLLYY
ncbi:unnamed protein product [Rotaria socialis]|uniref:Uncharacterized protein n=1 Tax=Rotaria socialis TaxID=392032 RepID=A0A821G095_9BILA|nr:unnamed protein product [Rotaria socialis]CAF4661533.1 unnamed protein product [Rotaria socialis]